MENIRSGNPTGISDGYSKAEKVKPSEEETRRVGRILEMFRGAEQHRRTYDTAWEFYKLYLQGYQMIGRDQITGETLRISIRPEDAKRLLSMENKLRPVARALIGKLTRIIPSCEATPRSEDQSDLKAAVIKTSFLEYISDKESLRVKYLQACRTLTYNGTAVFQLCWDKQGGDYVSWCKECSYQGFKADVGLPCPRCTAQFEIEATQANMQRQQLAQQIQAATPPPQKEQKQAQPLIRIREGELKVDKLSTTEFYPEPGVTDPKKLRYCTVRRAIPVTDARERFADANISSEDGIVVDRVLMYYGAQGGARSQSTYLKDHVYHYEYFEAPSALYPEGQIVHIINNRIVESTPNYYFEALGRLPFYFMWFEKNDGDFWGESFIAQAWHIQRERNRGLTQIREWSELTVRPKLLKPQKTKLGVDEIDTTPGQILEFNPFAGKPSYLEVPSLPDFMYTNLDRQDMAIREQASVTEQEMGSASGEQSGRFAAIQEAQSSETISPILVENNEEWKQLHKGILIVGKKYTPATKMWTVTGRDRVRSYSWAGASGDDTSDVSISEIDSLSTNSAIRRQEAREYLNDGIFTNPNTGLPDMALYMRVAGLKIPGVGPDVMGNEHAYFASVPERIANGEPFTPQPWDDTRIAVEELVGWLRGAGRSASPPLVAQIGQLYLYYLQLLPVAPMDANIAGSPQIPQGQDTGMGAGAMAQPQNSKPPGGGQSTVTQDAANTVQQADKQGEMMARGASQPHEG